MSNVAWLIPLLPALAAVLIFSFGKQLPKHGAELGITAMALALLLATGTAVQVFSANVATIGALEAVAEEAGAEEAEAGAGGDESVDPAEAGAGAGAEAHHHEAFLNERAVDLTTFEGEEGFEAGMRVDGLAAMMFLLVTFVSLMVQVYSTGYMHGDPRYTYFFGLLSLFTAAMLLLVIANNLMLVLVGWELVGICSFLLIGFWWEEKTNSSAAIKAFLTTKFGDVGLMIGIITLWGMFRTFNIGEIIELAEAGEQAGGELNLGLLTFGLLALFLGCVGKSAQFPLQTWLPDAMAGPTPVSALIHAATMVTAGVFLVARLYPLYELSQVALNVIAIIGGITLFAAGLLALVQDDVKKVLAYSTISQLGYMVAALPFSYTAGIFHLFTHGFFKALLFLGAGSLIHSVHSNNMSDMGGLRKAMPVTWWTFLVGSLALMAVPPLAGFWSKDEVLAGAFEASAFGPEPSYAGTVVLVLGALGGFVTAFYMTRVLWLVFMGDFRGHGHPHESPPAMRIPLAVLAVPAALIGFINLPFDFAHPFGFSAWTMFSVEYFEGHPTEFGVVLALVTTALALLGIALGTRLYGEVPERDPLLQLGLLTKVLENRYYLDDLYTNLVVRTAVRDKLGAASYWLNNHVIDRVVYLTGVAVNRIGQVTYTYGDQRGIDGAVNGVSASANWSGSLIKFAQSGNVQLYAGGMFVGVVLFATAFAVTT